MNAMRVLLVGLVGVLLGLPLHAEEPKAKSNDTGKPPWQRLLTGDDARKAEELQQHVHALFAKGHFAEAVEPAGQLWQLRRKLQGEDHWETLVARRQAETMQVVAGQPVELRRELAELNDKVRQASGLHAKGDYRLEEPLRQQVIATWQKVLREEHPQVAYAYNLLALCQRGQGRYAQAEQNFERALVIFQKIYGAEHPDTANLSNNVAQCQQFQGRYFQAEQGLERALTILRKVQGEEHLDTAIAYNNLALCQKSQGRLVQAEQGFKRVLEILQKVQGEERHTTATVYNNLAICQHLQSRFAQAEENLEQALAIRRKVLGEKHPDTLLTHNTLAAFQQDQGRYVQAEQTLKRTLAIFLEVVGEEHPHTAQAYHNLAHCQKAQGRYAQAEHGMERALAIRRKILGEVHSETATTYHNLATCYQFQGRYAQAERGYEQALAIQRKVYGEGHSNSAATYNNLAVCQQKQGHHDKAEQNLERALVIWRKVLGEENPNTASTYNNLATSRYAQGRYAEAEKGFERALAIWQKMRGEGHHQTAVAYHNLAYCQRVQGRYAQAEEGFKRALAIWRNVYGEKHPDTAIIYSNLAICLQSQGHYEQAEALFTLAADGFRFARLRVAVAGLDRVTFASDHSPLLRLVAVLIRNGKPEDAWQRFEENLGRGTSDELAARLRRTPDEQQRQGELLARLDHHDRLLQNLAGPHLTPEQEKQRQDLLTQKRRDLDTLQTLTHQLEQKYGVIEGQVFSLAQIQARLQADVAVIGWIDLKDEAKAANPKGEHWVIVVRAEGKPVWIRLSGSGPNGAWTDADDRLPNQLSGALRLQSGSQTAAWQSLAAQLSRQRLDPLAVYLAARGNLPPVRHLVILPSEKMDAIPLEVLTDRYTISRAPSATWYAHLRGLPKPDSKGLLAVADPIFTQSEKPQPLPPSGLLLTTVLPGSNAARAFLKPGDVLLRYDQTKLSRRDDLKLLPESDDSKATVEVEVWRDGQTFKRRLRPGRLGVVLADEPAPVALANRRKLDRLLTSRGKDGKDWEDLPGTRVEAEALRKLFAAQGQSVTLLTDADASEPRLADLAKSGVLSQARYLHFATHGTYDPRFPLQSAVILTPHAQPNDKQPSGRQVFNGELTAAEVLENWMLNAELVTLSACETALGKYEHGEGFMGFAQAVLIAGGRSVCLSLWKVDDTAAALLMERFYQNLLGKRDGLKAPLGKAAALAEAKHWLRNLTHEEAARRAAHMTKGVARGKEQPALPLLPAVKAEGGRPYAHPYYWAAFVLIGDLE